LPVTASGDPGQEDHFTSAARAALETHAITDELATRILELAQANRELETFSYTVSHDLRTPLTIIENYAHVLSKGHSSELTPEAAKALQGIHAAVQRMALLIQNILQLSRVMRLPLRRERTDLAQIARSTLAELAERDPARKVTVKIAPHVWANADAAIVRIVLANLLGNAWKFTGKKTRGTIAFGQDLKDGEATYFVRDNGAGFDMAHVDRLFQLFQRLHSASDYAGTGIGLATVARAVQRHDGAVWAQGASGKGATFYFTLGPGSKPAHKADKRPAGGAGA
jgi:light-regulated signal transduction histidine kinase (bacteriophytochrome)